MTFFLISSGYNYINTCGGDTLEQNVYVDLLFLIDFSMDFMCFYITSKILHRKISPIRTVLACILGGVYSVTVLFITTGKILSLFIDIAVCIIMCAIVFAKKKRGIGKLFTEVLLYFAVSALLGGLMTAIFNMLNRTNPFGEGEIKSDGISVWVFAVTALTSGALSLAGGKFFRKNNSRRRCRVSVKLGGKSCEFLGINDSGNLLKDPVTGKCVIPVELSIAEKLMSLRLTSAIKNRNISMLDGIPPDEARRIRIIRGMNTSGESMLVALTADNIDITDDEGKTHTTDALIAPVSLVSAEKRGKMTNMQIESLVPDELML